MAYIGTSIYIDGINISDDKFDSMVTFEITSTGLIVDGVQVWTYSGNLVFDGFTYGIINYPIGTTGHLTDFAITSNTIYLNSRTHANYYKVSSADLISVADAIRSKAGISDALEFPTGFVSTIGDIAGANTAVIDVEVTNGTATIISGEFPDWCIGDNESLIWGAIYINNGFVAGNIDNSLDIKCMVHNIFTDADISSIVGYSLNAGLRFGIMTDLSMIGFITNPESDSGFVPMTSGSFRVILVKCNPPEPVYPDEPIENNNPEV